MSKKANPTKIGLFILIGLILGVSGLVVFSSGKLFSKTSRYVLYFDASVKGLNAGAPVKYRGVDVGTVVDVRIRFNQRDGDIYIPVIIELNEDLLQEKTDEKVTIGDEAALKELVAQGLRGILEAQSLVTGLLYVQLDIVADAPEPTYHQVEPIYPEIPTVPTQIQELMENVASMDLKGVTEKLNSILAKLDTTLDEFKVAEIQAGLTNLLNSLTTVVRSPDLTNSLRSAHLALEDFRSLSTKVEAQVDPVASDVRGLIDRVNAALDEFRLASQNARDTLDPRAPLRREALIAIQRLSEAAQSIADLMDYLSRNPNALITGKKIKD